MVHVHRYCLDWLDHHQRGCTRFLRNMKYIYQPTRSRIKDNLNHQNRWENTSQENQSEITSDFIHFYPHTFCNSARKMGHDVPLYANLQLTCISTTKMISNSDDILPTLIRNTKTHSFLTHVTELIHRFISIYRSHTTPRHLIPSYFTTIFNEYVTLPILLPSSCCWENNTVTFIGTTVPWQAGRFSVGKGANYSPTSSIIKYPEGRIGSKTKWFLKTHSAIVPRMRPW